MWENSMLPWQCWVVKHKENQASPPHLNSNLDIRKRKREYHVSSKDNLRIGNWLIVICVLHLEATY